MLILVMVLVERVLKNLILVFHADSLKPLRLQSPVCKRTRLDIQEFGVSTLLQNVLAHFVNFSPEYQDPNL